MANPSRLHKPTALVAHHARFTSHDHVIADTQTTNQRTDPASSPYEIDVDGLAYGVWDISSGTGRYKTLAGGGGVFTGPTGSETWSDDLIGRVASVINEN